MTNCKNCVHAAICVKFNCFDVHRYIKECKDDCPKYKDKSSFIALPCKVGDTVYKIDDVRTECHLGITPITDDDTSCCGCEEVCDSKKVSKIVEGNVIRIKINQNKITLDINLAGKICDCNIEEVFFYREEAEKALL